MNSSTVTSRLKNAYGSVVEFQWNPADTCVVTVALAEGAWSMDFCMDLVSGMSDKENFSLTLVRGKPFGLGPENARRLWEGLVNLEKWKVVE